LRLLSTDSVTDSRMGTDEDDELMEGEV